MASAAADRRIVLLGKTGSGKSSLANTILGSDSLFKACDASSSGTQVCQSEIRTVHGRSVQIIDTPGLFDTALNVPFKQEILNCMIECAEGVHAFLLVLKVERFTKHELSVVEVICKEFSEDALKYTTLVFTQGDQMKKGVRIEEWVKDNKALSTLVKKCGDRCHVFDNKYWENSEDPYRNNEHQIRELLKTIDQTVEKNQGRCYTNANLEKMQEKLNKEIQIIKADPKNANLSDEVVMKKAKKNTFDFFWPFISKLGAVVGVGVFIGMALLKLR